jgi:hypothetical protein
MGMLKSPTPVAGAAATASEVVDENHPLGYGYKELFMPAIEGAKDQESSYAVSVSVSGGLTNQPHN